IRPERQESIEQRLKLPLKVRSIIGSPYDQDGKMLGNLRSQLDPVLRTPQGPAVVAILRVPSQRAGIEHSVIAPGVGKLPLLVGDEKIVENLPANRILGKPLLQPDSTLEGSVGDQDAVLPAIKLVQTIVDIVVKTVLGDPGICLVD